LIYGVVGSIETHYVDAFKLTKRISWEHICIIVYTFEIDSIFTWTESSRKRLSYL